MSAVDLSDRRLSSLEQALPSLPPTLTELSLAFNQLSSLGGGGQLALVGAQLSRLNLAHNRLCQLPPLAPLRHLVRLDLSHNSLSSLSGLEGCVALQELWLPHNKLSLDALAQLGAPPGLPALRNLVVCNNPADKIRPQGLAGALVLHLLPLLATLDTRDCAGEERKRRLMLLRTQDARQALVEALGQKQALTLLKQEGPLPAPRKAPPPTVCRASTRGGENCSKGRGTAAVEQAQGTPLADRPHESSMTAWTNAKADIIGTLAATQQAEATGAVPGLADLVDVLGIEDMTAPVGRSALTRQPLRQAACAHLAAPGHVMQSGTESALERAQRKLLESEERLKEVKATPVPMRAAPTEPMAQAISASNKAAQRLRSSKPRVTALSADTNFVVNCGQDGAAGSANVLIRADGSACVRWSGGRVAVSVDRDETGPLGFMLNAYYRDGSTCMAFDARGGGSVMRPKGVTLLRHSPDAGGALFDPSGTKVDAWPAPAPPKESEQGAELGAFNRNSRPPIQEVLDEAGHFGLRFVPQSGHVSIVFQARGVLHELHQGPNPQAPCNLTGDPLAAALLRRAEVTTAKFKSRRAPSGTGTMSITDSVAALSSNTTLSLGRSQVLSINTGI